MDATNRADELEAFVGDSPAMREVRERIRKIAPVPVPVLILGETGTGKELCARAIVSLGDGGDPVVLHCGAVPETLMESELFGHEKGSFTGAGRKREGLVASANGGCLFLDELGEIPLPVQAALLRTLESGEYRPIGRDTVSHSRFRLLAATNANVEELVEEGRLRSDFRHRLGAVSVTLPPLRDRREDIPALVTRFLAQLDPPGRRTPPRFSAAAMRYLMSRGWPGNIRELRNVVEAAASMATGTGQISATEVREIAAPERRRPLRTLAEGAQEGEREVILAALQSTNGDVGRAAVVLGVGRATLYRRLERYFPSAERAVAGMSHDPPVSDVRKDVDAGNGGSSPGDVE